MTTSTKELIAQIELDAKFIPQLLGSTDFKNRLEAIAQRLRELDKPDCEWVKLPCGRDASGNDINSYDPSCITVYTDDPLPMKLTKFCPNCGGAVKSGGTPNES